MQSFNWLFGFKTVVQFSSNSQLGWVPGNFREIFMYYGGEKPSISHFLKCFAFGLDQALLSKKITSMLKINAIRQWIAFLSKLGVIFSFYIVSFKFPGIPENSQTDFGKFPFPGMNFFREITHPSQLQKDLRLNLIVHIKNELSSYTKITCPKKPSVLKILHIMATNKKNRKIPMTVRGSAAAYAIMQVV